MQLDIREATPDERNALVACLVDDGWLVSRICENRYVIDPPWAWKATVSRGDQRVGKVDEPSDYPLVVLD